MTIPELVDATIASLDRICCACLAATDEWTWGVLHQGLSCSVDPEQRAEDWCRGLWSRPQHVEPRPARLAVRTYGVVTIVYMENPVVECVDPVCDECYQAWLESDAERLSLEGAMLRTGRARIKHVALVDVPPDPACTWSVLPCTHPEHRRGTRGGLRPNQEVCMNCGEVVLKRKR